MDDRANAVLPTSDGGYLVLGDTWSFGAGEIDFFVAKLDAGGNEIWARTFGGTSEDEGRDVIETDEGDFVLAGGEVAAGVLIEQGSERGAELLEGIRDLLNEAPAALIEAVRVNFLPVSITSLTTIVGFLSLNFSDSPPYWHLGNITAVGIAAAWLYSITLLPALISVLPYRTKQAAGDDWSQRAMDHLADAVIGNYRKLFVGAGLVSFALIAFIPTIDFNDQWVEYFDERIEFRTDSDEAQEFFGLYPIEYSVPADGPGGVSEPEFLDNLERFAEFLRAQPNVTHVYSLSDIMKRLNRNLHGDDAAYYRIPGDRELSAQYLLLYEL